MRHAELIQNTFAPGESPVNIIAVAVHPVLSRRLKSPETPGAS
jgi:hypothetical protein